MNAENWSAYIFLSVDSFSSSLQVIVQAGNAEDAEKKEIFRKNLV